MTKATMTLAELAENALAAVIQEAYVHGVSTRSVDALVKAVGMLRRAASRGVSRPVNWLCTGFDRSER
jgi:transposase-like protein